MRFIEKLHETRRLAELQSSHPWADKLSKVKGRLYPDGIERIGTQELFDLLDIPIARRQGQARRMTELMHNLGWTTIRYRALTRAGFRDKVRGFARQADVASNFAQAGSPSTATG